MCVCGLVVVVGGGGGVGGWVGWGYGAMQHYSSRPKDRDIHNVTDFRHVHFNFQIKILHVTTRAMRTFVTLRLTWLSARGRLGHARATQ